MAGRVKGDVCIADPPGLSIGDGLDPGVIDEAVARLKAGLS